MRSLITVVLAFGIASVGTFLFIRWVETRRIVAVENHRTMHSGTVPTGGGWPLLAAALLAAALLWPIEDTLWVLAAGAGLLALVSWADDVAAVNPGVRLAVHVCAAAAAVAALPDGGLVFQGALPLALDRLVAIVALTWFMNLYNFMDGIDGIACVETVAIAAGYLAVTTAGGTPSPFDGLALAIVGATLGFLVWNWAPARIFLGDVGSVPLGFLTGALMLDLAIRTSLAAALILPLYFAADATFTLLARVARGEKPWDPHRDHAYQRAARGLSSHAAVTTRVLIIDSLLVIVAVLSLSAPVPAFLLAALLVGALLANLQRAAWRA